MKASIALSFSLVLFSSVIPVSGAFASGSLEGKCQIMEVEPILEYKYVSETCTRTEYESCNCDNQGCQTCSHDVQYECGSDQWVRVGSKPLRPIEVDASLSRIKIGTKAPDGEYSVAKNCYAELDRGFDMPTLARAVIGGSPHLANVQMDVVENVASKLSVVFSAGVVEADRTELKNFFSSARIMSKKKIMFPALQNREWVGGSICVGKDRALSREVKTFGCQPIRFTPTGEMLLDRINLNQPTRRKWVYTFDFYAGSASDGLSLLKQW